MTRKLRWMSVTLVAALALAIAATGCGNDDSEGTPAPGETTVQEELSNQRYAEELRLTMLHMGSELRAVDNASSPESLDLNRRELKELGGTIRRTVDEFGVIEPPGDAQEGHNRILAALEDFSSKYSDVIEAVEAEGKVTEESFIALRTATFELQDQYLQALETLIDAGIEMGITPVGG